MKANIWKQEAHRKRNLQPCHLRRDRGFYVNGVEWKPPINAERRGFWACLPRKQMGFAFPVNWPNVVAFWLSHRRLCGRRSSFGLWNSEVALMTPFSSRRKDVERVAIFAANSMEITMRKRSKAGTLIMDLIKRV